MPQSLPSMIKAMVRPRWVKGLLGMGTILGVYDAASSQFELPKLGKVLGISGSILPWWGWLLVLQTMVLAALFEYVRRNVPTQSDASTPFDDPKLRSEVATLSASVRTVISDYQRMLGIEAKLSEAIADTKSALIVQIAEQAAERVGLQESLSGRLDEHRTWLNGHDITLDGHHWAMLAIYHRERMLNLAQIAEARAQTLKNQFTYGKVLSVEEWQGWQLEMQSWLADVSQWSGFAAPYLGRNPMEDITRISAESFDGEWSVTHDQFPDPEGMRIYKTFCTYLRTWEGLSNILHERVRQQAFEGKQTNTRQTEGPYPN